MVVDINKVREMNAYFKLINNSKLKDLIFVLDGEVVEPENKDYAIKHWNMVGLGNEHFIGANWPHESDPIQISEILLVREENDFNDK